MKKEKFFVTFLLVVNIASVVGKGPTLKSLQETYKNRADGQQVCVFCGSMCNMSEEICSIGDQSCHPVFVKQASEEKKYKICLEEIKRDNSSSEGLLDVCRYRLGMAMRNLQRTYEDRKNGEQVCLYDRSKCNMSEEFCSVEGCRSVFPPGETEEDKYKRCLDEFKRDNSSSEGLLDVCRYRLGMAMRNLQRTYEDRKDGEQVCLYDRSKCNMSEEFCSVEGCCSVFPPGETEEDKYKRCLDEFKRDNSSSEGLLDVCRYRLGMAMRNLQRTYEDRKDGEQVCLYDGSKCNMSEEFCSVEGCRSVFPPGETEEDKYKRCLDEFTRDNSSSEGLLDVCRYRLGMAMRNLQRTYEDRKDGEQVCLYDRSKCNMSEEFCSVEGCCSVFLSNATEEQKDKICLDEIKRDDSSSEGLLDVCRYRLGSRSLNHNDSGEQIWQAIVPWILLILLILVIGLLLLFVIAVKKKWPYFAGDNQFFKKIRSFLTEPQTSKEPVERSLLDPGNVSGPDTVDSSASRKLNEAKKGRGGEKTGH